MPNDGSIPKATAVSEVSKPPETSEVPVHDRPQTPKKSFRLRDPDFKMLFSLFIPIFIDMILNNLIGAVHSYFVSGAGENVISAISLANQANNLISIVFLSATSAVIVVVSQNLGQGNHERARLVAGQTMMFTAYGTLLVAAAFCLFPAQIMTLLFGNTGPEILDESIKYIPLLGISLPFYGIFQAAACTCRGYNNHKLPLYISVSGSIVNVILAFFAIKVMDLGVVGAGLSLIISRLVSAVAGVVLLNRFKMLARFRESVIVRYSVIKSVLYLGFLSSLGSILTNLASTMITGFIVPFGKSHLAASSIFGSIAAPINVPISVWATLATILVAKHIGKGENDKAKLMLLKCAGYSIAMELILWIPSYFILPGIFGAYTDNPETLKLLDVILKIQVINSPIITNIYTIAVHGFNGAGDAKFTTIFAVVRMFIVNFGLGYVLITLCSLGVIGSILASVASGIIAIAVFIFRYKSGKWEHKAMV